MSTDETTTRGSQCSVSGGNYEKQIFHIVKNCTIDENPLNTQEESQLGGSSATNDIVIIHEGKEIGVEVKKYLTPDWMQCSIVYGSEQQKWKGSDKCKIPVESRSIFNTFLNELTLFDGEIPPFMKKDITHEEWVEIKNNSKTFHDTYLEIPSDTIRKLYHAKGCHYIQVSDDFGLYHLGEDVCDFQVPLFDLPTRLRVRTKVHSRKNKKGFCSLSVTVACQPTNIKTLPKSPYSLDNIEKLPTIIVHRPTTTN